MYKLQSRSINVFKNQLPKYICSQPLKMASEKQDNNTTKEGKAEVFLPTSVFYNPVQQFNRDLSINVISQHMKDYIVEKQEKLNKKRKSVQERELAKSKDKDVSMETESSLTQVDVDLSTAEKGKKFEDGIRILEGLAASGLRSVRFALEIPGVKEVIANDFDANAVEFIKKNAEFNKVSDILTASCADAAMLMYQNKSHNDRFDVIDLDPYGTPAPFLDATVQAVQDGGLLCITCTDLAVLCGNAVETCHSKYGAMSLKSKFCHELALRIVLQCIESHANRYSRYIVPLLSISVDFYLRVFVKVYTGQSKVKESASKMATVYHCTGCGCYELQKVCHKIPTNGGNFKYTPATGPNLDKKCRHCGGTYHIGGPVWAEKIHDVEFLQKVINNIQKEKSEFGTASRIEGMLSMISEELQDVPLFYVLDDLCKKLHCDPPGILKMRSAIMNAGYSVSFSHAAKNSLKTDAPAEVIWDVLRCWVKEHPVKAERLKENTPAKAILSVEPSISASFEIREDANPESRKKGLLRWQENPERDWGPKAKAKRGETESLDERRNKGAEKSKKNKERREQEEVDLKQFSCKRQKKGECDLGDDCKYSHEEAK